MAACTIHSWTLRGLIGAFFDLALAYFLLSCSLFAVVPSKILGIPGTILTGLFNWISGHPNSDSYLQELLLHWPSRKVSAVQVSAKTRFPFDFIWANKNQSIRVNVNLVSDRSSNHSGRALELDEKPSLGEALEVREGGHGVTGMEMVNKRRSSVLLLHCSLLSGPGKDDDGDHVPSGTDVTTGSSLQRLELQLGVPSAECRNLGKDSSSSVNFASNAQDEQGGFAGSSANAIKLLEHALEKERTAHAALYLELEKERESAAIAAEAAMTMITHLQKDKALIEMKNQQYQRMMEEKSAFEEEEMNILKELIVRRERDNHFLAKELEAYKQMLFPCDEPLEEGPHDKKVCAPNFFRFKTH